MPKQAKLCVGDLVRVFQSGGGLGPTLFVITYIGEGGRCYIREAGNPRSGHQQFDTSLLRKVERDPLDQRVEDIKSGKIKQGPALLARHFWNPKGKQK